MKFDLTTEEDIRELRKSRFISIFSPAYLTLFAIEKALSLFSSENIINKQKETAIALIKAAKENNVDEFKIMLDQNAGIDLQSSIEGIPMKFKMVKMEK